MSSTAPPGWYDDGQGGRRWWDGSQWGAAEQPAAPPTGPPPATPPYGQQYGQQPYGAPQSGAPKKRTGLIIGIVAALVLLAGGIVAAVLLGGDGASSDDPAETVQSYVDAVEDGDCDAVVALLTDDFQDEIGAGCSGDFSPEDAYEGTGVDPDDITYDVGEAEVDGDEATVPLTVSGFGSLGGQDSITSDYGLVKEDGEWLISSFGTPDLEAPSADLPSDFPTEMPSGMPSDFEMPSGVPTDFGDLPTDPAELEQYLEDLQSELDESFPTE